jgi:hypothetical protein
MDLNKEISAVEAKISRISDAWRQFFLEYESCKKEINYNSEVRTNYVADVFIYLRDTLPFLLETGNHDDSMKNVFNVFGLLQAIYVHQDLMGELLFIFKLPQSSDQNKSINRNLRNELVGHPLRRRNDQLISSVFLGRGFHAGSINYVRYDYPDGFKSKVIDHSWNDILTRHFNFLNTCLDQMGKKIGTVIKKFQKNLVEFLPLIATIPFEKVIDLTTHRFEILFKHNDAYDKQFLISCDQQSSSHPRYKFLKDLFLSELTECITQTILTTEKFINPQPVKKHQAEIPRFTVELVQPGQLSEQQIRDIQRPGRLSYEFSKLYEDHPVFGVDFFMQTYGADPIIHDELQLMKANPQSPLFIERIRQLRQQAIAQLRSLPHIQRLKDYC